MSVVHTYTEDTYRISLVISWCVMSCSFVSVILICGEIAIMYVLYSYSTIGMYPVYPVFYLILFNIRNYPTRAAVARKLAEQREKEERGDVLPTRMHRYVPV